MPEVAVKVEVLSEPDFALIQVKEEPLSENSEDSALDRINKLLLESLQREEALKVRAEQLRQQIAAHNALAKVLFKLEDKEILLLQAKIRELEPVVTLA